MTSTPTPAGANETTDPTVRTTAFYDAIDAFQRTHRLPSLQHAQIRGLLAEHLARTVPAVSPLVSRAAVLHEAADAVARFTGSDRDANAKMLRRMADEAQQPETQAPVCVCGHPMHQHHEDVCLTECGCNDGRELDDATDLPGRLAAVLTARFTELGNPFAAMRYHEQGPDGWPASHSVGPNKVADVLRELLTAEQPVSQPGKEA